MSRISYAMLSLTRSDRTGKLRQRHQPSRRWILPQNLTMARPFHEINYCDMSWGWRGLCLGARGAAWWGTAHASEVTVFQHDQHTSA
jgi:hypothetical protein